MIINPYELLGVTPTTPLVCVKKNYYSLALLAHPDKGGSEEDMLVLQRAYEYVKREIMACKDLQSLEELETDFTNFCKVQEATVPMFSDIYADAFDLDKFNTYFDAHASSNENVWEASDQGGYGAFMQYDTDSNVMVPITYPFEGAIQEYKAPKEVLGSFENAYDYLSTTSNYSYQNMSDYKEAFTYTGCLESNVDIPIRPTTIEELIQQRDEPLETSYSEYIWSFTGFVDGNGEPVNMEDVLKLT